MSIEEITKPLGGQCPKCLKQKVNCVCIKHEFQVGDYVRYNRSYAAEQRPHRVTRIAGNKIYLGDTQTWSVALQKWDPQEGELVWFYNDNETLEDLVLAKFTHKIEYYYGITIDGKELTDYMYCQPFIGTLPTITYEKDSN